MLDETKLIETVQTKAGFASAEDAMRAIESTVSVLGEALTADEAESFARELPPSIATRLTSAEHGGRFDLEAFYERVARREGTRTAIGLEHAQAVLASIAEAMDPEERLRLQKHLGERGAFLFEIAHHGRPPSRAPRVDGSSAHQNLAEGRLGSRHPLSESHALGAQSSSVAEANPHAESKLSSAHGMTQEALSETLATGHPGPKKSLGDA